MAKITNTYHIIPDFHAIYGDIRLAQAINNIYSHRILEGGGIIKHYEDDCRDRVDRRDKDINIYLICF